MVIEEALYAFLAATAGVTALVSTRIYPQVIPQDAVLPAIAYQRISGPRVHSQSGASGLAYPRFQFTCQAATYSAARQVANAVRAALDGYRGTMGGAGGVSVGAAFVANEIDGYSEESGEHTVRLDVVIYHAE